MKGDITLKINKKIGLVLIASLGFFAMADFVSVIGVNAAGGMSIEKEDQIVGSVVFRMDDINPSTIYGGTWELITGDASLSFGDGTIQDGLSKGNNIPSVPLLEHNHTINHNHPMVFTDIDSHRHDLGKTTNSRGTWGAWNASNGSYGINSSGSYANKDLYSDYSSHSHEVDLPNYSGNSGNSGDSNATLDVRGERISINVWKRVS